MLTTRVDTIPELQNLEIAQTTYIDYEFPRHLHETYVIEVVIEGCVEFDYAGKRHLAPAGSIILIQPEDVHTGRSSICNQSVTYWSFCPRTEWMQWFLKTIDSHERTIVFQSPTLNDPRVSRLLKAAHDALQNQYEMLHSESLMILAFSYLLQNQHSTMRKENEPHAIHIAKEYLNANFSEQIHLTHLAQVSGLSSFYFLRTFQKATGLTPHEYLCNLRVEKARKLLATGASISDTAIQTGFVDQSHLHRHFRRLLGITPGKYRAILYKKRSAATD
jgi:AraC-like DNA-binding protein